MSNPSLILPQSPAYGEDYVYAAQVEDGAVPLYNVLPLTFTRASGGTRINKDGLVQNMPYNLIEQSETFNTTWGALNLTVTANTTTAPNGTTTADSFSLVASADASIYQGVNGVSNNYTISVYAKYVSGDKYLYFFSPLNSQGEKVWFDIQNGTVSNQLSGFTGTIEDAVNGWYKCSMYNTTAAVLDYLQMGISTTNSSRTLSNNSVSYFWGAQINLGTAKPYFPTTDRLNVPRLTYQNGGGGCPSLLLEKQSTNKVTYSEQFDNANWNKLNLTITANSVTSPDGTQNADTITDNTTNSGHYTYQFGTQTTGTAWSCFMKKGSLDYGFIGAIASSAFRTTAIINLTNGSIVELQNGSSTTGTVTTEDCGNGWYRVKMQTNANGAGYSVGTSNGASLSGGNKEAIYTGTGSGTIYLWGAQLEDSTYATSYIPTTSSSATRVADICNKTGISSLIGQTEGVAFIDFDFNGNYSSGGIITICLDGGAGNELYIWVQTSGLLLCEVANSGSVQASITGAVGSIGRKKIAFAYKQNDFAVYLNGTQVGTDTSGTVPTMSRLYVGKYWANDTYNLNAGINQAVLFPTRLSNSDLIALTTI